MFGAIREHYKVRALSAVRLPRLGVPEVATRFLILDLVSEVIVGWLL